MEICLSPDMLTETYGRAIAENLDKENAPYRELHDPIAPYSVCFAKSNGGLDSYEPNVLLFMKADQFNTLVSDIQTDTRLQAWTYSDLKRVCVRYKVTLVIPDFGRYTRKDKTAQKRKFVADVRGDAPRPNTGSTFHCDPEHVEQALITLRMCHKVAVKFIDNDKDIAKLVHAYWRCASRREEEAGRLTSHFSFYDDVTGVAVSRDGTGGARLWREQLQALKGVSASQACAVAGVFPTPRLLWAACQCEARPGFLQEVLVRRGAGVLETSRRLGPECARRVFSCMTSRSGEKLVK